MAKTKDNYFVTGNTLEEIRRNLNFMLQRLADRIDKMEGIRGTASIESNLEMNSNAITEVGVGVEQSDAARLADVDTDISDAINQHVSEADPHSQYAQNAESEVITGAWQFKTDIKVYDASDNLIHSME